MTPVQLGLDQWNDVDVMDTQALEFTRDHRVAHPRGAEPHTTQVDVMKRGATETDLFEPRARQVDLRKYA